MSTSKTLRLDDLTIQLIESYPGDTFTAKFSNLVETSFNKKADLQKQIKSLEAKKARLLKDLSDLQVLDQKRIDVQSRLSSLSWYMNEAEKSAETMYKGIVTLAGEKVREPSKG